jgi:hypothetical protein
MPLDDLAPTDVDADTAWVFTPIRRPLGPGEELRLELRRLTDGRRALLVYTSLRRLLACCGEQQSWASFPVGWLPRFQSGYDTVAVDRPVPLALRGPADDTGSWPGKPEEWDD